MASEPVTGANGPTPLDWERMWAPYDEWTYGAVLAAIEPEDIVLDIGAGDLRLARRLAARARRVYAVERNAALLSGADALPPNLIVIAADARLLAFPPDITAAVLLMRHCRHFAHYWRALAATRCRTLLTNARWGLGVERIDLCAPRNPYAALEIGWYGCACGGVGFVPGSPERLSDELLTRTHEVRDCPACAAAV